MVKHVTSYVVPRGPKRGQRDARPKKIQKASQQDAKKRVLAATHAAIVAAVAEAGAMAKAAMEAMQAAQAGFCTLERAFKTNGPSQ